MDAAEVTTEAAYTLDTALRTTGMDTHPMRTALVTLMIRGTHTIRDTLTIPVMTRGLAAPGLTISMATGFPIRTALRLSRITTIRINVHSHRGRLSAWMRRDKPAWRCVQRRLAYSVGGSPTRATVRNPVAWIVRRK